WLEVPATHHATLPEVLGSGFARGAAASAVPLVDQALGIAHAVDAGIWHLMQVTTTAAGENRGIYLAAWGAVLVWSALKVAAVWMLLLGAVTLTVRLQTRPRQAAGDTATLIAFALVVATAGTGYLVSGRLDLRQASALGDPCRDMAAA